MPDQGSSLEPIDGCCEAVANIKSPRTLTDRRALAPRTQIEMPVEVFFLDQEDQPSLKVLVKDVSLSGMAFRSPRPSHQDEKLMIILPIANGAGRMVLCRTRHCKKIKDNLFHVGVEFIEARSLPRTRGACFIPAKWLTYVVNPNPKPRPNPR